MGIIQKTRPWFIKVNQGLIYFHFIPYCVLYFWSVICLYSISILKKWFYTIVQLLLTTIWHFLIKFKIDLWYNPAIPFLDIYPRKMKVCPHKNLFTTFIAKQVGENSEDNFLHLTQYSAHFHSQHFSSSSPRSLGL